MNLNKFMFASMILGGLSACSKDDVVSNDNGNGGEVEGAAYMSLSIAMPSANNSSRAIANLTDEGTEGEQKVTNLSIFIWPKNPSEEPLIVKHYAADKLTHTEGSNLYTTEKIAVKKSGNHRVAVIVNGFTDEKSQKVLEQTISTPEKLRNVQTLSVKDISAISTEGHFLMTNANTTVNQDSNGSQIKEQEKDNGSFYEDGTVSVDVKGSKEKPTTVTIPVERSVAKIVEETADYDKVVVGTEDDHVVFQEVTLVNANTKFYPVKQVRPISSTISSNGVTDYTKDEKNYYIVDPNFEKQNNNVADFLYNKFKPTTNNPLSIFNIKKLTTTSRATFYTLENTMIANEQMNAYTTGLYYKAQYKRHNAVGHVYNYYGKVYNWAELTAVPELKEGLKQLNNGTEVDSKTELDCTNEQFGTIGVVKYKNGICYYPYWIRHINNSDNLAPMEFGVVRNNSYKMYINKVKGIGSVTPENPNPETPDEDPEVMLEITVKVMPWTVRGNIIDF